MIFSIGDQKARDPSWPWQSPWYLETRWPSLVTSESYWMCQKPNASMCRVSCPVLCYGLWSCLTFIIPHFVIKFFVHSRFIPFSAIVEPSMYSWKCWLPWLARLMQFFLYPYKFPRIWNWVVVKAFSYRPWALSRHSDLSVIDLSINSDNDWVITNGRPLWCRLDRRVGSLRAFKCRFVFDSIWVYDENNSGSGRSKRNWAWLGYLQKREASPVFLVLGIDSNWSPRSWTFKVRHSTHVS